MFKSMLTRGKNDEVTTLNSTYSRVATVWRTQSLVDALFSSPTLDKCSTDNLLELGCMFCLVMSLSLLCARL
jgi:hypothetical protein